MLPQVSDFTPRFLLGRPFVLSMAAMAVILLVWQRHGASPPKWRTVLWMTPLIAAAVFLHGVWYLWALPVAAFFLAQQFRWCFLLAASWILGTLLGSALTGHPVESILQAVQLALRAVGMHQTQLTLVSELQPVRRRNLHHPAARRPDCPAATGEAERAAAGPPSGVLARRDGLGARMPDRSGFGRTGALPALAILIAGDLQLFFESRFAADSFQRLALVCGLALTMFAVTTNDFNSRWTNHLAWRYLTPDEPEIAGWLPDKGGTFYTVDQSLFYQTFFKNPNGDWRYVLGFESTLMPDEDFKVYHNVAVEFRRRQGLQTVGGQNAAGRPARHPRRQRQRAAHPAIGMEPRRRRHLDWPAAAPRATRHRAANRSGDRAARRFSAVTTGQTAAPGQNPSASSRPRRAS